MSLLDYPITVSYQVLEVILRLVNLLKKDLKWCFIKTTVPR